MDVDEQLTHLLTFLSEFNGSSMQMQFIIEFMSILCQEYPLLLYVCWLIS